MIEIYFKNKNNYLNRKNKPAYFNNAGEKKHCLNGKPHRENGPAFIWLNGTKTYFLNGCHYTKEEYYEKLKELNIND